MLVFRKRRKEIDSQLAQILKPLHKPVFQTKKWDDQYNGVFTWNFEVEFRDIDKAPVKVRLALELDFRFGSRRIYCRTTEKDHFYGGGMLAHMLQFFENLDRKGASYWDVFLNHYIPRLSIVHPDLPELNALCLKILDDVREFMAPLPGWEQGYVSERITEMTRQIIPIQPLKMRRWRKH